LINTIEFLQNSGVQVYASSLEAEGLIQNLDFKIPIALIVGSEDLGIQQSVMRKADKTFIIPQVGTSDSFNVSVAAGIMLYEVMRQRFG
jgi:23S rRNA (guanosine2251-2'-O)-methyltransferase